MKQQPDVTIVRGHMGCGECRRFTLTKFSSGWQAEGFPCHLRGWGSTPDLAIRDWRKQHKRLTKTKRVRTLKGDLLIMGNTA